MTAVCQQAYGSWPRGLLLLVVIPSLFVLTACGPGAQETDALHFSKHEEEYRAMAVEIASTAGAALLEDGEWVEYELPADSRHLSDGGSVQVSRFGRSTSDRWSVQLIFFTYRGALLSGGTALMYFTDEGAAQEWLDREPTDEYRFLDENWLWVAEY